MDGGPEGESREDRHLGGGVAAADVFAGVGLGKSLALSLGQGLGVARAAGHLGEDEVGGAVDDPVDALHVGSGQGLGEHAYDRDDTRDGRLEAQLGAAGARGVEQFLTVLGEQLLVGGDDVLAGARARRARRHEPVRSHRSARRSARSGRGSPGSCRWLVVSVPPRTGGASGEPLDLRSALREQGGERRADRAMAEQADVERARGGREAGRHLLRGGLAEGVSLADIAGREVLEALTPDHDAGVAVFAEQDRWARDTVVVARHRKAVGAGGGRDDHIPGLGVLERGPRARSRRPTRSACPSAHSASQRPCPLHHGRRRMPAAPAGSKRSAM